MFKKKKKSPSAKDISSLSNKSDTSVTSQIYSSLPKSIYSGNDRSHTQSTPTRSLSGSGKLNLAVSTNSQEVTSAGSGASSPLDLPMETLTSINVAHNLGRGHNKNEVNANKLQGRSPYQSPVHSVGTPNAANNISSMRHRSLEKGEVSVSFPSDPSIDRQFEQFQMMMPTALQQCSEINNSSTMPVSREEKRNALTNYSNRERSQEREQYPYTGARSLEKDHYCHVSNKSKSDRPDFTSQLNQEQFRNLSRDSLILELQSQITELNKDCAKMQQELDSTKDKLSSTMNSIKTFWSPELKKERSLRKEESAKNSLLNEQYKATHAELKKCASSIRDLENRLHDKSDVLSTISKDEEESLKQSLNDQTKEVRILQKTVEELEFRLETQKHTLMARDESIKKLLGMLQCKGLLVDKIEESQKELELCCVEKAENLQKLEELRRTIETKDEEMTSLQEKYNKLSDDLDHAQVQLKQQPASTHTLQAILEAKNSRIAALEKELTSTENKLDRLGECDHDRDGSLKKDGLTTKEKALKVEIDMLKMDVGTRDNEIVGLKMKLDMLTNQECEHQQYINVLKDQIKSKEEQVSMFQADIDDLRDRVKDKDDTIDKKSRQSQSVTVEKRKLELECAELKDNLDTKERKINILQRKIENLEQLITEKEDQLTQVKTQSTHSTESSDSAISAMEESISEKDKQIEKLREQRDVIEVEHQHECEQLESVGQQLKAQLDQLQLELGEKQTELCELREEVSELKSIRYKADVRLQQLELNVSEKDSELAKVNQEIEELKAARTVTHTNPDMTDQLSELNHSVDQDQTEVKIVESEVGRLLDRLKECENEKNEKESQIKELQDTLKEYKQKFGTLKRQQHKEKQKNANLLEEARRREEDVSTDAQHLMGSVKEKDGRIGELEEALCESVKITAEREMLLMEQKMQIDASQNKIEELLAELEKTKHVTKEYASKLASYIKHLEEKDLKLKKMASERHKHLEEVFDMKQEALQAAICEKDANIALLEMTSSKNPRNMQEIDRLSREKDKLNQQLKELVHNRTKYLQERNKSHKRSKSKEPKPEEKDDKSMEPAVLVTNEQDTKNS